MSVSEVTAGREADDRVLDALHDCILKWGIDKVTIDDIAENSGVSRASIYRMFPGGKDVIFEALRVRSLNEFFEGMRHSMSDVESLLDLVVQVSVYAINELRRDEQLLNMLATEESRTIR